MGCVASKAESVTTSSSRMTSIPIIFWTNIVGFFTRTSYIQVEFSAKHYHRKQRRREREAKRRQMALQLSRFDTSDENLVEKKCQSWVESLHEAGIEDDAAVHREKARLHYLDYMENW